MSESEKNIRFAISDHVAGMSLDIFYIYRAQEVLLSKTLNEMISLIKKSKETLAVIQSIYNLREKENLAKSDETQKQQFVMSMNRLLAKFKEKVKQWEAIRTESRQSMEVLADILRAPNDDPRETIITIKKVFPVKELSSGFAWRWPGLTKDGVWTTMTSTPENHPRVIAANEMINPLVTIDDVTVIENLFEKEIIKDDDILRATIFKTNTDKTSEK